MKMSEKNIAMIGIGLAAAAVAGYLYYKSGSEPTASPTKKKETNTKTGPVAQAPPAQPQTTKTSASTKQQQPEAPKVVLPDFHWLKTGLNGNQMADEVNKWVAEQC